LNQNVKIATYKKLECRLGLVATPPAVVPADLAIGEVESSLTKIKSAALIRAELLRGTDYNCPPQIFLKFTGLHDSGMERNPNPKLAAEIHFYYLKNSVQF